MATIVDRALKPVWFRFTSADDQGKYGEGWFRYSEAEIISAPARDLIALERELGMTIHAMMNNFRSDSTLGDLAVSWLGVRSVDPARAGEFDSFNPMTNMIDWTAEDPDPKEPEMPVVGSTPTAISPSPLIVDLETWPVAESAG